MGLTDSRFAAGLTVDDAFPIIALLVGAWLSLVERTVRDREVGGSNPLAPTKNLKHINNLERHGLTGLFFRVGNLCPEYNSTQRVANCSAWDAM